MQELRILLDLDMLHKNYKEVIFYIDNLHKTFPGLVKYSSIEAHREPDPEDNKEDNKDTKENSKEDSKEIKSGIPTEEI